MYYYILNPVSGGGRINKIQDRLKSKLKELGIAGEFVKSIGEGDVTKLTAIGIRKGYKTIVAVGGNGTINEVINGVGKSGVAVGIIPIGDKNELAKSLGIPDWQTACNILAARKIETLDIGRVGKSYFITSVDIGFEAEMAEQKPAETSLIHKTLYYKKALSWSSKFKPQKATLNLNDEYMVDTDFFNIKITNSLVSNRKKEETKSMLNILVTGKMSHLNSLKYIVNPDSLKQEKKPDLSLFRTKRVVINTLKHAPVAVDGKVLYKTPVLCEISDRKLKIIVARKKGPIKPAREAAKTK
ncbi:MAG: Diacylglycerol kinase catalytic region [uncultured bacterium]|nr:MAG: Diacylglycerol kinase catalytic region [uncultured bacterium]